MAAAMDTIAADRPAKPRPKTGILEIEPYVGGKAGAPGVAQPVKLSSNENVLGSSLHAHAAFQAASAKLHIYPDGRAEGLRNAVAETFRLEPGRLIFGCGSDEVFTLLAQTYLEPGDNVIQGEFGFLAYRIAARAAQAEVRFAPMPALRFDVDQALGLVDDRTRLVFLDNPGNPTGGWLRADELERLHRGLPGDCILVIDGAYAEFVDDPAYTDGLDLARAADNVVVTRTFSKIHGLAALRVGWGYGPAEMISAMDRIRGPFNVNLPAQAAAIAALGDAAFQAESRALVLKWRPWLTQQIGGLGLEVLASQGNFVLVGFQPVEGRSAEAAEAFLASRGILVRGLANYGLPGHLRITVGLEPHNRAVVEALADLLGRSA
jgi:histidinol-phosphate aminotransferase